MDRWQITDEGRRLYDESAQQALSEFRKGVKHAALGPGLIQEIQSGINSADSRAEGDGADPGIDGRRLHWKAGETKWHSDTVQVVAGDSGLVGIDRNQVVRTWFNSLVADDGSPLWKRLLTQKRPDVVFELTDGKVVAVEVEPCATLHEGIAQLAGDYVITLEVDRAAAGDDSTVKGVLVTDRPINGVGKDLVTRYELQMCVHG